MLHAVWPFEAADEDDEFKAGFKAGSNEFFETGEFHEEELFGEVEELLDDAIAFEGTPGIRDERFVFVEADGLEAGGGKGDGSFARAGGEVAEQDLHGVVAEEFVEGMDESGFAVEEEAEGAEIEFIWQDAGSVADFCTEGGGGTAGFRGGGETIGRFPLGAADHDGPERDIKGGAEAQGETVDGAGIEDRAAGDGEASDEGGVFGVRGEFGDRHGGDGPDEVGIDDTEEGLGDFGELVVDFEVNAGGQESERFDHAFDVGILALGGLEKKAAGDFGVLIGELGAHLAQKS